MSSARLERKRRSELDISDDSDDEQPPLKVRKHEVASNFSKRVSETCKALISWIAPKFIKNYLIVKGSSNQARSCVFNMGIEDSAKSNGIEEDDEISVIAVTNGISGVPSQIVHKQNHVSSRKVGSGNKEICPLASTPLSFPITSHGSLLDRASEIMERRQRNKFLIQHDSDSEENRYQIRTKNEKCIAPITNPVSDIEILLDDEKEIEILSEVCPAKHSSISSSKTKALPDYYCFKKNKTYTKDFSGVLSSRCNLANKSYTACEVVRLQDKANYKALLEKVAKRSIYHPAVPRRKSQIIQIDLTEDDKPKTYFKKEKIEDVSDFVKKYYKPCALVPYRNADSLCHLKNNFSVKVDEEDPVFESLGLPKLKPREKSASANTFFSEEWIQELKMTMLSETERRLQIVSETQQKIDRFQKKRDAKIAKEKLKREEYLLAGIVYPEDVEMEEEHLPDITPEMDAIIDRALCPGDRLEKLVEFDKLPLTRLDVSTLAKLNWLNDQVINFYLALIVERSKLENFPSVHAYNSFFYTSLKTNGVTKGLLRWTRKIDIFSYDIIIVPLHLEMHWALLIVDNRTKEIKYYDSMGSGEEKCLRHVQNYLVTEMQDKKKITIEPNTYSLEIPKDIPKQMNGSDCGMFTLKYAEYISRDAPITFTQANMPYFRRRMVYELLSMQIL